MLSGLSHDPLHRDILTTLQLGATIVVPDPADLESPRNLAAWMNKQEISVANLTPAMAQLLTEASEYQHSVSSLRVSCRRCVDTTRCGEVTKAGSVRDVRKSIWSDRNSFCTESFCNSDQSETAAANGSIPIEKEVLPLGKGIKDVQLLLLNASNGMGGIGEVGEICFRSPHLTKGYLGDDALTRERFVINPFTNASGDRLYRTGDLGRYLPDGNVEFLGRLRSSGEDSRLSYRVGRD